MRQTFIPLAFLLSAALSPAGRAGDEGGPPSPPKPPAFKVPKGWHREKADPITSARFRAGEGDKAAAVTVTALRGDGGGLTANVNRWRAQVGLGRLTDAEARKAVRPVKVGGADGYAFDVTGPDAPGKPGQRVVAAFVRHGGDTWYFKLAGPAGTVGGQKAAFEEFLKSVRFAGPGKK
jgi:hypothetical protein